MAKLILSFEGTALKTINLDKERITLGRRPENDIQVDNLGVSGEHAVVTTILNDSVIEDLNSTNGTVVNGEVISKHLLQHNDVIEIGKHKLKYSAEAVAAAPYTNFEKTMVIRRPAGSAAATPAPAPAAATMHADLAPQTVGLRPATPATSAAPAAAPPRPVARAAAIQVLSGTAAGRVLDLTKPLTTIGKAGVQVAVLARRPAGCFLTHVEGPAFPLLNGAPIGAESQLLSDNDTIEIGGIKMAFNYKD